MTPHEIIQQSFREAVFGLTEDLLNDQEAWFAHVLSLPIKPKTTYLISVLDQQVLNGGFHQYFYNPYGQFGYQTIPVLQQIGAYEKAALLKQAVERVNSHSQTEHEFAVSVFERTLKHINGDNPELESFLDSLDEEYYKLDDHGQEDLDVLLTKFLTDSPNEPSV